MNHTLLNEKYRPQNLDTFVGNENVKQTISQYLSNNDIQNFIFYGPKIVTGKRYFSLRRV